MKDTSENVEFFLQLAKTQAIMNRRFDSGLGGLGLSELIILLHLSEAPDESLRRIDLADRVGLTASAVTRLLLPMEKVGLVKSGESRDDARVRTVRLAPGGKMKLGEGLDRMELLLGEIVPDGNGKELRRCSELLSEIAGRARVR